MKRLGISLGISFVLTLIGSAINYFGFTNSRWMPLAIKQYGGEYMGQFGFGWVYRHIYAMEMGGRDSVSFSFSIINFLLSWLLVFLTVFLIVWIIKLIKK